MLHDPRWAVRIHSCPLGIIDPQNEFVWSLEKTRGPTIADDNFCVQVPPQLEKLTLAEQSHKSLRIFTLPFFRVFIQITKSYSYVFPFQCCHLLQLFRGQHSKSLKVFHLIGNCVIKYDHMFSKIWIQIRKLFAAAIHYQNQLTISRYFAFFVSHMFYQI